MFTNKGTITPILIAVIVMGFLYVGYIYYNSSSPAEINDSSSPIDTNMPVVNNNNENSAAPVEEKAVTTVKTVTLTKDGFSPASITIKMGEKVIFKNEGTDQMWVASGPHPTHTNYPEFDEKTAVSKGQSYEFTFTKVGSWKYHNHLNPEERGTVIVE